MTAHPALYGGAALLLIAIAGWYFFLRNTGSGEQLLIVHRADFADQISVSGTVAAAEDVDLGFAQNGRVSGVYAKVGDTVRAGALLAQTENGDLRATLAQKQATLQAQDAKLESLRQGTRPEELAVTQVKVDNDTVALAQANQGVVNAIQNAYTQADDAVHNRVDQFINNPRTSSPQLAFTTTDSQLANSISTERLSLEALLAQWQTDTADLSADADLSGAVTQAQRNLMTVSNFLGDINAALTSAITTSSFTQSTLNGYITSVATGRTNISTAASGLTTALSTQQSARTTLATDQKNLALEQAGSTQADIDAQVAQVAAAQADVDNAQAQLAKTLVTAPFSGTITKMDAKVGEIVSPSISEISMISSGTFEITSYVPEVSIAAIAVGDPASTTLDAYGPSVVFAAKVIAIDPAETVVNGVSTYKTTLQFLAPDLRIRAGMTASVVILAHEIPNAIVIPEGAVYTRNGQQFVQVVGEKGPVERQVRTGNTSALGQVEIIAGLENGDQVVLNPAQ